MGQEHNLLAHPSLEHGLIGKEQHPSRSTNQAHQDSVAQIHRKRHSHVSFLVGKYDIGSNYYQCHIFPIESSHESVSSCESGRRNLDVLDLWTLTDAALFLSNRAPKTDVRANCVLDHTFGLRSPLRCLVPT